MCQSHTGRLTGLWFLPKPAFGLNTNDDDDYIVKAHFLNISNFVFRSPSPTSLTQVAYKFRPVPNSELIRGDRWRSECAIPLVSDRLETSVYV